MCGIFGVIDNNELRQNDKDSFQRALKLLSHRGPDDSGIFVWDKENEQKNIKKLKPTTLLLGHTRLSIMDLSSAGHQPMSNLDNNFHIVFNGEIYNYLELRDELIGLGYEFYSNSDTEMLLIAFIQWGHKVLDRLIGMFAFAILDVRAQVLFLARDNFGIKPLFYSFWEGRFSFSSEISPLLDNPSISKKLNPQKIYEYLQYGNSDNDEMTMLEEVKQLPPAHFMEIDLNTIKINKIKRYWQPTLKHQIDISFDAAANELRKIFLKSVNLHLRSDVPVGAALSGGIDSSAIVCAIRFLQPKIQLHTFTYVASHESISEEKWADIVGRYVGAVMHKVSATPMELVENLDQLIMCQGEPFASTSIYAQHKVFQKASEVGIKVMLDGQGADEIFGGYSAYAGARFASLVTRFDWLNAWFFLKNASAWPGRDKNMILKTAFKFFIPEQIKPLSRRLIGKKSKSPWLNENWFKKNAVSMKFQDYKYRNKDHLREELLRSLGCTSIPMLLRYEDRNSMVHSIESRVPFLNKELVEFVFSLPEEYLIDQQGTSKAIFRKAMRGLVPDEILDRRDKIGFETPEEQWLKMLDSWVNEMLDNAKDNPFLNYQEVKKEWREVMSGNNKFDWHIWRWINILRWIELYDVEVV
jgi:asparagine synthase (glutamine-hydrolysing)